MDPQKPNPIGAWARRAGGAEIPPGIGPQESAMEEDGGDEEEEAAAYLLGDELARAGVVRRIERDHLLERFGQRFQRRRILGLVLAEPCKMRTGKYDRDQAIAIGLNRARKAGLAVPAGPSEEG